MEEANEKLSNRNKNNVDSDLLNDLMMEFEQNILKMFVNKNDLLIKMDFLDRKRKEKRKYVQTMGSLHQYNRDLRELIGE
jgi:hypothetical protein